VFSRQAHRQVFKHCPFKGFRSEPLKIGQFLAGCCVAVDFAVSILPI
jgi:hypothetical protein